MHACGYHSPVVVSLFAVEACNMSALHRQLAEKSDMFLLAAGKYNGNTLDSKVEHEWSACVVISK